MERWANNPSEWATNMAGWSNATGGSGNLGWAKQTGDTMPCSSGCTCAELQYAYTVCASCYNTAIASTSGTAINPISGGSYTANVYMSWMHVLQNKMSSKPNCKVPQVTLNNPPTTTTSVAHAIASGTKGGVKVSGGAITSKAGNNFKNMITSPSDVGTGDIDPKNAQSQLAISPMHINRQEGSRAIANKNTMKVQRPSFFAWLLGK